MKNIIFRNAIIKKNPSEVMRCLLPEDFFVDDSMIDMLYFFIR